MPFRAPTARNYPLGCGDIAHAAIFSGLSRPVGGRLVEPNHANNPSRRRQAYMLAPGEKKVDMADDPKVANTTVFTLNKEDHTLGALLQERLLADKRIHFAGYKMPHPNLSVVVLRVTTDGSVTPKDALKTACTDIVQQLDVLARSFRTEWLGKRMVAEGELERERRERDA